MTELPVQRRARRQLLIPLKCPKWIEEKISPSSETPNIKGRPPQSFLLAVKCDTKGGPIVQIAFLSALLPAPPSCAHQATAGVTRRPKGVRRGAKENHGGKRACLGCITSPHKELQVGKWANIVGGGKELCRKFVPERPLLRYIPTYLRGPRFTNGLAYVSCGWTHCLMLLTSGCNLSTEGTAYIPKEIFHPKCLFAWCLTPGPLSEHEGPIV